MATQMYPDNGELDVDAYERPDAYDVYEREHRICLRAAQCSRRDGDMAGWADFMWDAACNREMLMIERGHGRLVGHSQA